jgi:hypothetical protein
MPNPKLKNNHLNGPAQDELLLSFSEPGFEFITQMASLTCEMPITLVSLIDENGV